MAEAKEKKATKAKETDTKEKSEKVEVVDTKKITVKDNNTTMIIGVVSALVVLILVIAVSFFAFGGDDSEDSEGGIPDGYEVYETAEYEIGYPKEWEYDDTAGEESLSLQPTAQIEALENTDPADIDFSDLDDTVTVNIQKLKDEDKDMILEGNCQDFLDKTFDISEDDFDLGIETSDAKEIKVGGDKACQFSASISFFVTINTDIISVANDDVAYSVTLSNTGSKGDNLKAGEKVQSSFSLK
ncbi:MAG: hypothetical protein Q9M91_01110 [Candidatus Dojkabacteria bacterium]|nr:hypothetical protein [Candidatus Dojkabacteria bacterium]MDQ7020425.1 hypothetical protein [Candidatus Dojkabacteria bacterium]